MVQFEVQDLYTFILKKYVISEVSLRILILQYLYNKCLLFEDNLIFLSTVLTFFSGIETGVVKPLPTTVFEKTQLEQAWRYLASGKHIGKVLIKLSDEESNGPVSVSAIPRIKFNPGKFKI